MPLRLRDAASFALILGWKCSALILGAAIAVGMLSEAKPAPTQPKGWSRAGRIAASDDGRKVRATLNIAEAERSALFVLCDAKGREIIEILLFEDAHFSFRFGADKPVRMSGCSASDGNLRLVLDAAGRGYEIDARLDGSAGFRPTGARLQQESAPPDPAPVVRKPARFPSQPEDET